MLLRISLKLVLALAASVITALAQQPTSTYKFDFGPGKVAPGYAQVLATNIYSKETGYGFEPGASVNCVERKSGDDLHSDLCTSDKQFQFSVAVPEGNYNVKIIFGDAENSTVTTVKAETRRLMIEKIETTAGKFADKTITVNVRTSQLVPPPLNAPGGTQVRLNSREDRVLHWDEKLTLEFDNARPSVCAIEITKVDDAVTVFLAGDSTVTDQPREPGNSWGQMLTRFFQPGVAVANYAESGETLKSFITALRLDKALSQMKAGDYLFMQFGHNDMKENWPQTYVAPFSTYKAYLKVYIAEARRRGAIPVLVTSMNRRTFDANGKITNSLGDFPEAVRQTATEEKVALIDLNAMSKIFYEALGPEKAPLAFGGNGRDATHHNNYGSYELAKCIVEGIKANKLDLAKFLVTDVPSFDPAHPDAVETFSIAPSPTPPQRLQPQGPPPDAAPTQKPAVSGKP